MFIFANKKRKSKVGGLDIILFDVIFGVSRSHDTRRYILDENERKSKVQCKCIKIALRKSINRINK